MMQGDREIALVDAPQLLKYGLGLAARIDEYQRGAMGLDQTVYFIERMAGRMSGPRQPFARVEHADIRRGAGRGEKDVGTRRADIAALRHHEAGEFFRLRHRRRQADTCHIWRKAEQACKTEREQVAAL